MEEERMEKAKVRCLSDIIGLQKACQTENLTFSAETNKFLVYQTLQKLGPSASQKLLSKLVDDGCIQWDEDEDYEVEDILDHADEDGKRYYLIKWEGWSDFHNSWEPAENLHCPSVVAEYLAAIKKSSSKLSVKRSLPKISESAQITKRRKVDEIFHKLWCSPISSDMSPIQLLTMHTNRVGGARKNGVIHKGLVPCHDRAMRPKFSSTAPNYTNTKKKVYKQKQREIQEALKEWQRKLNAISTDPASIVIENNIDLEGPPENFVYINDYRAGEGIEIPQDPLIGCECEDCYEEKKTCCGTACGSEFAYYGRWKRLRVPRGTPIYECNKRCKCGPDCPNRVVQAGRMVKVCIFRTSNGRGWGVKTLQKIKKGTFVMEYVGEVITNEEAERRGKVYDAECRTYLFDLDYNDGDCPFTVDAGYYGNVSHFVNHSCEPNLVVYGVWINTLDPRLPRICLFADRDIERGEELTFDYMMTGDTTQQSGHSSFSLQLSPGLGLSKDTKNGDVESVSEPDSASVSDTTDSEQLVAGSLDEPSSQEGTPRKPPPRSPSKSRPLGSPSKGHPPTLQQPLTPSKVTTTHQSPRKTSTTTHQSPSKAATSTHQSPSKAATSPHQSPSKAATSPHQSPSKVATSTLQKTEKPPSQQKMKYRMICQCGSTKCRKYLF